MEIKDNNILTYIRNIIFTHRKYVDIVRMGCELLLLVYYTHKPIELSRLRGLDTVVDLHVIKAEQEKEKEDKVKVREEKVVEDISTSISTSSSVNVDTDTTEVTPPVPPTTTDLNQNTSTLLPVPPTVLPTVAQPTVALPAQPTVAPPVPPPVLLPTVAPDWHVKITGNFQTIVDAWCLDTNADFNGSDSVIIAGVEQ